MSVYKSAVNHNVALVSLVTFVQQPKSEGVKATRRIPMGDGSILYQGLYVQLTWDFIETPSILSSILSQLGLVTGYSSNVTIYARDDRYNWVRYNGVAIRPEASWNNFFIQPVTVLIRNLEEA